MRVPNKYLKWDLNKLIKERDRLKRVTSHRDKGLTDFLAEISEIEDKTKMNEMLDNWEQTLRMKQHIIMLNRLIERQEKKEDES